MTTRKKITDEPDGATPLEPEELEGLIHQQVRTRSQLDQVEQINILEGLRWLGNKKNQEPLTEAFVLEVHKKLFGQVWVWAGKFRKSEKNIGCDPLQIAIQLRQLLDNTNFWIEHQTYKPLEIAARFHHGLVKIHLFSNGNGRHARIIADTLLAHTMKQKPIDWAGGQDLQNESERWKTYIAALRAADGQDYDPLLIFVGSKTN